MISSPKKCWGELLDWVAPRCQGLALGSAPGSREIPDRVGEGTLECQALRG